MNMNVIIENLTELLTNTVNMTSVFYDIFLNPEPMDVELQQYNNENRLVTVTIPNRAKDSQIAYNGEGSPEGKLGAPLGAVYVDTTSSRVYVKAEGTYSPEIGWPKTGWVIVPSDLKVATDTDLGLVKIDDSSITMNSNSQIQAAGLINRNDGVTIKTWVGTQGEYDFIGVKDSNTIYYII
jgi:hypothetical protein